jgi:hypothetical protein
MERLRQVADIFHKEIRGVMLFLVLGTLAGIVCGFFGGLAYGNFLAEREISRELTQAKAGFGKFQLESGKLPSKVSSFIISECQWAGITFGLPIGAVVGLLIGGAVFWSVRQRQKGPIPGRGGPA